MKRFASAVILFLASLTISAQEESLSQEEVKELQGVVEELRGMKFKRDVKVQVLDEKQLRANMVKMFDEQWPVEKAKRAEAAYKKLGLLPEEMDLRKTYFELMSDSLGGYYDPKTKELYLVKRSGDGTDPMNEQALKAYGISQDRMTTIHELTHALQDQHFDLSTIPTDMEGNDDVVTALQCLFEGEANFVMYEHVVKMQGGSLRKFPSLKQMFGSGSATGTPKMNAAPELLKRGLMFPYMEGMVFLHAVLVKGKEWESVKQAYTDLPLSTEQILHPEKYAGEALDTPQVVTLPDLGPELGLGWDKLEENVMGELTIQILLGEYISRKKSPKTIAKAAAGWDGDRFAVYEKDGEMALVWYSTWDSEADAAEFAKQAKKCLEKKIGAAGLDSGDGLLTWEGGTLLETKGTEVLWLETFGRALTRARTAVWNDVKKSDLTKIERKAPTETPKKNAMVENAHYRLNDAPRKVAWKADENGDVATITWKGFDGGMTFTAIPKDGDAASALKAAVSAAKGAMEGGRRGTLELDLGAVETPMALVTGEDETLGNIKVGIVVLESRERWIVARLATTEAGWEKARKHFERVLNGYEAKGPPRR